MHEPNVKRILNLLSPTDVVLDIGGWARPFNRANYVIDAEPFETRGFYGDARPAQGGTQEFFTKETWIQRDLCDREPFPFGDNEIDFAICSHTLEDIRDPLWVCSEIARIAKCGYIEVPSRIAESCRGVEPNQVGWSHHRWLVDIEGAGMKFLMKYHTIHSHWRFSLPESYLRRLSDEQQIQFLFWDDSFEFSEMTIHGVENIAQELESFVRRTGPYKNWLLQLDRQMRQLRRFERRVVGKARSTWASRKSRRRRIYNDLDHG
jgi:hypothetical protein